MKTQPNKKIRLHGECTIKNITEIPANAVEFSPSGSYHIVADSETTGNHHVIDKVDGVRFYKLDDLLFVENKVPTTIRCLQETRHDDIVLEPGVHEFGTQLEYDYLAEALRKVRD